MSDTKISEACERCGRCRQGDFANCKNARNLAEASRDALPFVAYAYSQGIEGAEEAGRAVESALEAAPLHTQPAELAEQQGAHDALAATLGDLSVRGMIDDVPARMIGEAARKDMAAALAATGKQQVGDIDPRAALGWEKARAALQVGEVQGDALSDRTPADYAIEHAGYLVTAANQVLEARNELDALVLRREEDDDVDEDEMQAAQESVGDANSVLRIAIHEFEKRRDRALAARQPGAQVPVVWSVLQIGNVGAAYDPKGARRAFTYEDQPGNIVASNLGRAANTAAQSSAGDNIDRGLSLLKSLQENGFGVFQIGECATPPTQGIDLGKVREIRIPARNNLDPISVFVQDQAAGRGRIVVTCYGNAWQAFWGAMGNRTVMEFVAGCDADYVAGNMISGRQTRMTKAERAYTERIAAEVIAEFRALREVQRDAGTGVGS